MATATSFTPDSEITLFLNKDEADTLATVCAHIGGATATHRRFMTTIGAALRNLACVKEIPDIIDETSNQRAIYFTK